jgi:REP element-mobilizing transposase RayT
MVLPLEPDTFYHIHNRAVGNEKLFTHPDDYAAFLKRIKRYLLPSMDFFAYCLLPNHFHFLVRTHPESLPFSKHFSDCCNSYTKWRNRKYRRLGGLFMTPFSRKPVREDSYLTRLIWYIHRNPLHHFYCTDIGDWPWSSYKALISEAPTLLQRKFVLNWFGGKEAFITFHQQLQQGFREDPEH